MSYPKLILASASPRRDELLRLAGFSFTVEPADVDESPLAGEPPADYAARIALAKAVKTALSHPSGLVLGADTVVFADGEIMGKPADKDDARAMLRRLSGRVHEVLTGIAIVDAATGASRAAVETTRVRMREVADEELEEYLLTGEPMDKAGAYGIQGRASVFVLGIEGCFFNVVGLPLSRLDSLLRNFPA